MSLYAVAVPAPSPGPPTGGVPGEHITLGGQRGAGPVLRRPCRCSRSPVQLLAVFLAAGRRVEGVKPVTFGPFRCSSAGHLQISTIRLGMDLETM